jgi:protein-disulfide isomerase
MKLLTKTLTASILFAVSIGAYAQQDKIDEIEAMLQQNPEIIESVYQSIKQYQQQRASMNTNMSAIYNSGDHPAFGNLDAASDQQIVVFTDYNCPYCKRLEPVLEQLLENYPELKVVNVIVPLRQQQLEGIDTNSAFYAQRVWQEQPEKFKQVHDLLMAKNGMHSAKSLRQIASKTNTESLLAPSDTVEASIRNNYKMFSNIGLRGTPGTVVGKDIIPGLVPYENLLEVVKANLQVAE